MIAIARPRRAWPALLAAPALLVAGPAAAHAASVSLSAKTVTVSADAGEANRITIKPSGADIVISDGGVATIADGDGDGGGTVTGRTAGCPAKATTRWTADPTPTP